MTIIDRYAGAVHSRSLAAKRESIGADVDVLGAAGFAAKSNPLGMALLRLFVGDNRAAGHIVEILARNAIGKAYRLGSDIGKIEAEDIARAVLAWHRDSRCKPCGGHGVKIIKGTKTLGDEPCCVCLGAGRLPFDSHFGLERLELARWMADEIDKKQGEAGREAMKRLAPEFGAESLDQDRACARHMTPNV